MIDLAPAKAAADPDPFDDFSSIPTRGREVSFGFSANPFQTASSTKVSSASAADSFDEPNPFATQKKKATAKPTSVDDWWWHDWWCI